MEQPNQPMKEGFLHKSHPRDRLLSVMVWQKRYFILWCNGIMEYYTNYTKRAEEYCGTLNLADCQDMIAPTSVGKRQNVIKLAVMKEGKLKHYLLDCDYPTLLNTWVKCIAEASGLAPEVKQGTMAPHIQQRQLPAIPVATADEDYVSSDDDETGANYEEIEDEQQYIEPDVTPRRYTRLDSEGYNDDIATFLPKTSLLKREPIKEKYSPSVKHKAKPLPAVPEKPHLDKKVGGAGTINPMLGELHDRLNTVKSPSSNFSSVEFNNRDSDDEPTEDYELVQFTTDVVIGSPRSTKAKPNPIDTSLQNGPSSYIAFQKKERLELEYSSSPEATPTIPPRDFNHSPISSPPALPPRGYSPSSVENYNYKSYMFSAAEPPAPPLRERSLLSPTRTESPPPPPRHGSHSSSTLNTSKRIVPYRTTVIPPKNEEDKLDDDSYFPQRHSLPPTINELSSYIHTIAPVNKPKVPIPPVKPKPNRSNNSETINTHSNSLNIEVLRQVTMNKEENSGPPPIPPLKPSKVTTAEMSRCVETSLKRTPMVNQASSKDAKTKPPVPVVPPKPSKAAVETKPPAPLPNPKPSRDYNRPPAPLTNSNPRATNRHLEEINFRPPVPLPNMRNSEDINLRPPVPLPNTKSSSFSNSISVLPVKQVPVNTDSRPPAPLPQPKPPRNPAPFTPPKPNKSKQPLLPPKPH